MTKKIKAFFEECWSVYANIADRMVSPWSLRIVTGIWFLAIFAAWYVDYGVILKCNPQQIGYVMLSSDFLNGKVRKNHYVGYFASFRDGTAFIDGRWVPVVYNDDGSLRGFHHRWWPRFYRLEMKEWNQDMYANIR